MKQNTTYKQTELGLIPDDWEVKKLGECSSISGDYGINAPAVKFSEDLPTYLRITDIDDDGNYSKVNKVSVKDDNSENFILENQDIVFARTGATVGKTYLHDKKENGDLVFAGFLIRFRTNRDVLLPYYLKLYSTTDKYWNWVSVFSMRSGQPGINSTEYSNLKIPLPPLPEQKKIADCLSTWDIAIEKQSQLINALTQRKKALMQQLLTGKKRLPGFSDEWKEVKLGEIIIDYKEKPNDNNNYEIFTSSKNGLMKQTDYYGDNRITNRTDADYNIIPNGFITYRSRSDDGLFTFNLNDLGVIGLISGYYPVFSFTKSNTQFLLSFLNYFKSKLIKYAIGTSQLVLSINALKEAKFKLPSLEEQTAIAAILATADRELQLQKEKLAQLQTQKKGLMQVLLTGKKRLMN